MKNNTPIMIDETAKDYINPYRKKDVNDLTYLKVMNRVKSGNHTKKDIEEIQNWKLYRFSYVQNMRVVDYDGITTPHVKALMKPLSNQLVDFEENEIGTFEIKSFSEEDENQFIYDSDTIKLGKHYRTLQHQSVMFYLFTQLKNK